MIQQIKNDGADPASPRCLRLWLRRKKFKDVRALGRKRLRSSSSLKLRRNSPVALAKADSNIKVVERRSAGGKIGNTNFPEYFLL